MTMNESRITRDDMLMAMAFTVSMRSTCSRLHVGAVIAYNGRVLTSGYNGTPAGMAHCDHSFNEDKPCTTAVHAEANAIAFAARHGVATEGACLYTTHMPCYACAQLIINAGIVVVSYNIPYRDESGMDLLYAAGVDAVRIHDFKVRGQ